MLSRRTLTVRLLSELAEISFDHSASTGRWIALAIALRDGPVTVESLALHLLSLNVPLAAVQSLVQPIQAIHQDLPRRAGASS
jgi:hypothetical protein